MKKFSALPLLLIALQIFAQSKENERFVLGFFAGLETQSLGIQTLGSQEPEQPLVQSRRPGAGCALGFFARKRLWRGLSIQPEIAVSFAKNKVNYRTEGRQAFRFWDIELPLHFVVTDWRRSDFPLRGCVIFGGRLGWNFTQNPSNLLKIAHERVAIDLGLGAEIKSGRWRIQPAFVYSHGMNNLHVLENATYDDVVGRVVRDKLSLRISVWKSRK